MEVVRTMEDNMKENIELSFGDSMKDNTELTFSDNTMALQYNIIVSTEPNYITRP